MEHVCFNLPQERMFHSETKASMVFANLICTDASLTMIAGLKLIQLIMFVQNYLQPTWGLKFLPQHVFLNLQFSPTQHKPTKDSIIQLPKWARLVLLKWIAIKSLEITVDIAVVLNITQPHGGIQLSILSAWSAWTMKWTIMASSNIKTNLTNRNAIKKLCIVQILVIATNLAQISVVDNTYQTLTHILWICV